MDEKTMNSPQCGVNEDSRMPNRREFLAGMSAVGLAGWTNQAISAAEACFAEALEVARGQGALFWELRAALSLARLRIGQERPGDARAVLAPAYDRCTEGFETADLRSATAMLERLPGT